jgi:hypothetical protein
MESEKAIREFKEKCKMLSDPKALLESFIADPLLYISYIALAVYYLLFSHVHLLTISYCCSTYRNVKSLYLNDFSVVTALFVIYNLYQIFQIFYAEIVYAILA